MKKIEPLTATEFNVWNKINEIIKVLNIVIPLIPLDMRILPLDINAVNSLITEEPKEPLLFGAKIVASNNVKEGEAYLSINHSTYERLKRECRLEEVANYVSKIENCEEPKQERLADVMNSNYICRDGSTKDKFEFVATAALNFILNHPEFPKEENIIKLDDKSTFSDSFEYMKQQGRNQCISEIKSLLEKIRA